MFVLMRREFASLRHRDCIYFFRQWHGGAHGQLLFFVIHLFSAIVSKKTYPVVVKEPVEKWPICDCLIAFHSRGFPLEKSIQYAKLRSALIDGKEKYF